MRLNTKPKHFIFSLVKIDTSQAQWESQGACCKKTHTLKIKIQILRIHFVQKSLTKDFNM